MNYSYDANDRLTTDTYDADGNTTSSAGIANTYDFENRILTHGGVSLVYDGDGNRVSETAGGATTKYLVDSLNPTGYSQVMDEIVGGAVTRTYAYGLQRISENQLVGSTWTPSFYGYDGHGNVRFMANSAGTITDTYTSDAFGAQIASTGTTPNPYLYSGERFDSALNLYHLRARYYNALTGRFETMDPAAGNIFEPLSLHKYVYTWDNPVNASDPTGRDDVAEYIFDWKLEIKMLNREAQLESGKFGFEFLHAFHFAHSLGECDEAGLQLAANALAGLTDSPQEAPSEEFLNCIPKALWNILNPIPWVPFPLYPGQ